LLSADGSLAEISEPGPFGARFRKPLVLLARALCHYEPYSPPGRLPPGAQDQAALLAAEVNPPFETSGTAVVRTPGGYGIWSWNQELVDRLIGSRGSAFGADHLPETLLHDPGDGVRIVSLAGGEEAQAWQQGSLRASMYVPGGLGEAEWRTFLGMLGEEEMAGHPPPATERRFVGEMPEPVRSQPLWRRTGRLAAGAMAVLLVAASFLAGETLRLEAAAAAERARIGGLAEARAGSGEDAETQRAISSLRDFRQHLLRPDPVFLLAEAERLAALHGLEVTAFTIDTERLRLGLSGGAPEALEAFALDLEQSRVFTNVSPQNDRRSGMTFFLADATGMGPGGGT
jgi:hypothetical protein